jgi:hypothetical protein
MFPKRIKHVFTSGMSTSEARKGKSLYTIVNDECQDTKYIYACIDMSQCEILLKHLYHIQ